MTDRRTKLIITDVPADTGITLSRGQKVHLDFSWKEKGWGDDAELIISELSGSIYQPSGQCVRDLTEEELKSLEENNTIFGYMAEHIETLTEDPRAP